jgi:DNA integrity scanning protein DisA with diadenylate cyclase activity
MNATELADKFKEENNDWNEDNLRHWGKQADTMLRQQQAEIETLRKSHIELERGIVKDLNQRQSAEPVAWIDKNTGKPKMESFIQTDHDIPLYTQDQLEEARKLGMQQERAMWELAALTQEIMDTHPVKELTEDMLWEFAEKFLDTDAPWGEANVTGIGHFIEAILRKAQQC